MIVLGMNYLPRYMCIKAGENPACSLHAHMKYDSYKLVNIYKEIVHLMLELK